MSIKGWSILKCHRCDGTNFVPRFQLQYQSGLGTAPKPDGYQCLKCNSPVDTAKAVAYAQKQEAQAKIRELESQLDIK